MSQINIPGGGVVTNSLTVELATLLGLTGIAPQNASVDASDFIEDVNTEPLVWTKSGTLVNHQTLKGGVWTANVVGASTLIRPIAWSPLARASNAFGFGWRGKFDASAIAAGCLFRGGLVDSAASSKGFYVGFFGTTFTGDGTVFNAGTYDGTSIYYPSTILVNNAWHNFRVWSSDGVSCYFAVDAETPILMNGGHIPGSTIYMKPWLDANTAQNQMFDYFVAVTARE